MADTSAGHLGFRFGALDCVRARIHTHTCRVQKEKKSEERKGLKVGPLNPNLNPLI